MPDQAETLIEGLLLQLSKAVGLICEDFEIVVITFWARQSLSQDFSNELRFASRREFCLRTPEDGP